MVQGRMGPLTTVQSFTDPAGNAHFGGGLFIFDVHGIAIHQIFGLSHIAAHGHGQAGLAAMMPAQDRIHGAGNGQKSAAVRHAGLLGVDRTWRAECIVNNPARTGPPKSGKNKAGAAETFRNIPGMIDADKKERHPPRALALQGGQTVANLFKADTKAVLQNLQIIA